jgi:hypothetical protein
VVHWASGYKCEMCSRHLHLEVSFAKSVYKNLSLLGERSDNDQR